MAYNRCIFGQTLNNLPSRFINELPPQNIEIINNCTNYFGSNTYNSYKSNNNFWQQKKKTQPSNVIYDDDDRYSYVRDEDYAQPWSGSIYQAKQNAKNRMSATPVGSKVYHSTFGYGKVIAVEGNKLEIMFEER